MKLRILHSLLLTVFIISILGAGSLVWSEIQRSNICPILMGIPACYIIMACFIVPFIVHLLKRYNLIYFLFTGIAGTIALFATVMEIMGKGECPKTTSGTPMCFYSLIMFTSLIVLKVLIIEEKKNTNGI